MYRQSGSVNVSAAASQQGDLCQRSARHQSGGLRGRAFMGHAGHGSAWPQQHCNYVTIDIIQSCMWSPLFGGCKICRKEIQCRAPGAPHGQTTDERSITRGTYRLCNTFQLPPTLCAQQACHRTVRCKVSSPYYFILGVRLSSFAPQQQRQRVSGPKHGQ